MQPYSQLVKWVHTVEAALQDFSTWRLNILVPPLNNCIEKGSGPVFPSELQEPYSYRSTHTTALDYFIDYWGWWLISFISFSETSLQRRNGKGGREAEGVDWSGYEQRDLFWRGWKEGQKGRVKLRAGSVWILSRHWDGYSKCWRSQIKGWEREMDGLEDLTRSVQQEVCTNHSY